jgi:drug/metabolite transporter (DMT)-like permease
VSTPSPIHEDRDRLLGLGFALIAAVGFSAKAVLVKLAYRYGIDTISLLALRMALSAPFFVASALWVWRQSPPALSRHDALAVIVLGCTGYYLSSYLDFLGLQHVSAGLERLILFLYPTVTVLVTAVLYRRGIPQMVRMAMALSYVGLALVFVHDMGESRSHETLLGSIMVFGSMLAYSFYLVGTGHVIARVGVVRFTAYAMLVSTVISLGQFLVVRGPHLPSTLVPQVLGIGLAMAVFSTVLPVFMLSFAIRRIGSDRASLIGSVGPVSTILLAWWWLGERVTVLQVAGSAMVLLGVMLIGRTPVPAKSEQSL